MGKYFFYTEKMSVGYDGVPLIRDVRIELEKGQILTLIGPNGAGKSTILKSIAGQLRLLGGAVYLERERLDQMGEKEMAKKLSLVLTDRIRPELMTCEDVVAMGRYPYTGRLGVLSGPDWEKVRQVMELVHIADFRERDFSTLSDGQKQRVMLARALCQEPEILILDEPTSFLDIKYKLEFLSILQKLTRKKELTVIMSLHELELAQRVSDRILCVKGAYISKMGTPEEVCGSGHLKELYDIQEGSLDERTGIAELPACIGTPRVFVIGGGGSGRNVYRRLQRQGIPFSTGILAENDLDYPVAKALAVNVIAERAFFDFSEESYQKSLKEIARCEAVVCAVETFGRQNEKNRDLMAYAERQGKLVTMGDMIWQK